MESRREEAGESRQLTSVEICAGGGGQALGLEAAGFEHVAVVEIDKRACETLRHNRPSWNVIEGDVRAFSGHSFHGVDLLAGGVPCPPFSMAGKQLGADDERDLFPEAIRLVGEIQPRAVLLENVRGLSSPKFANYRAEVESSLRRLGYSCGWRLINASDHGVPQLRPRFILVGLKHDLAPRFCWPEPMEDAPTVGESLVDLMASNGWKGADSWADKANQIAPTIVGGSKKHGGPDLGPTRAKRKWAELGVDGMGVAYDAPGSDFPVDGSPKLTVRMVARIQGFPDDWTFLGKKTPAYRQVGNAFPPPVAAAVGRSIASALRGTINSRRSSEGLSGLPLLDLLEDNGHSADV
jgi:DNA (cytosine-5)-methyltransferase 1